MRSAEIQLQPAWQPRRRIKAGPEKTEGRIDKAIETVITRAIGWARPRVADTIIAEVAGIALITTDATMKPTIRNNTAKGP